MTRFTSLASLAPTRIHSLVERASNYRELLSARHSIDPVLEGMTVANLFFEPSTRTRLSFDLAAQLLGAKVLNYDDATSSSSKGETLRDTVSTVASIGADVLVVRHGEIGTPDLVADWTGRFVVNAGDGAGEHPTQTLLDVLTIQRHFRGLDGLHMVIVGDIAHSRVANGLIRSLPDLGVRLTLAGPPQWMPEGAQLPVSDTLDDILNHVDIVYLLRVQTERGGEITGDFVRKFGVDSMRAAQMSADAVIMHPGPINRGVEISDEVADGPRSLILEQVANGVPSRMAVLELAGEVGR